MKNRVGDGDVLVTVERLSSCKHLVEDYADSPQVRACIRHLAAVSTSNNSMA